MADLLLQSPIQYEPHKKNRWVLRFPDDVGIQTFALKSVDSPKTTNNKITMEFLNTATYVKGRTTWEQMAITIRDFIAPASTQALIEWQRLHHESVSGRDGYAVGYMKDLHLEGLDPIRTTVKTWRLEKCMLVENIDFGGTLDYAEDGVVELTFNIQPQRCILLF